MIPVELSRIIINEKDHDQAIVLKEKDGARQVPIVIGYAEAASIQMAISGIEPPRPLTHDLLASVIKSLDAKVDRLIIDDLAAGTFFAKLYVQDASGQMVGVDCRPSDGIALAVRLGIGMFVEEKVFEKASIGDI